MSDLRYIESMPRQFEPWQYYPSLTTERLTFIATIMRNARDGAVALHDVEAGDSNWSLGCRVYDRIMSQIRRASQNTPWLTVVQESQALRFTFAVGSIPLKFFRGDAGEVPGKYLVGSFAELRQMELALELEEIELNNLLRIAIESDASGKTSAVTLVEVDRSGNPFRTFDIPLEAGNVIEMKPKPINVEPPVLEVINEFVEEEAEGGAAEGTSGSSGTKS